MKPPPFRYHAPASLREAVATLAEVGADGKVLAGGQSLIPLLNMRLAAPGHLVDVNGIVELDTIEVVGGQVRVGAGVRATRLEHDAPAARACPLLRRALRLVAHPVIRNRGTVCGSIAHADPAAELPAVLALLGGRVCAASAGDGGVATREIDAAEFFVGPLQSALRPTELVESVAFPALAPAAGTSFEEVSRRHGDYAVCGVAALVELAGHEVADARVALVSVGPTPVVVDLREVLGGTAAGAAAWAAAAEHVRRAVEPDTDLHAGADYRRHLAGVLTRRALTAAEDDARARLQKGLA